MPPRTACAGRVACRRWPRSADFIVSAVTASQAVPVAQAWRRRCSRGAWFLDFNSASPGAKRRAAALIDGAGGRYVEGAVMTSIPPYRIKVPLLLGGARRPRAGAAARRARLCAKVASDKLGVASATKMCRSVMIKGLEAMVIESFTAARAYGVEDAVLASLHETFPGIDWEKQGAYFFQRVIEHGRRRSEEVREVAETVREIGLTPWSAPAAPPSARPGSPTWPTPACSARRARRDLPAAPTGASRPTASSPTRKPTRIEMSKPPRDFTKTPGWLDWYAGPTKPRFQRAGRRGRRALPCVRPGRRSFRYAPERKYTPCDASKQQLFALRDHLGFARNVVVQATCHGADNRAMVDALHASAAARRVAWPPSSAASATPNCRRMHDAGVRGVRFNFVKRLVDFTPKDELLEIAGRIAPLGWHVVIYFEAVDLPELWDFFTALPTTVVVDHMGRPDVSQPVDGPQFELFVKFMREHANVWSKVSCPERLSRHAARRR